MQIRYTLTDRATKKDLTSSVVYGTTSFFVGDDITTDERQAMPLAAEEAGGSSCQPAQRRLVAR